MSDGKSPSQPACRRKWKKCKEENEQYYECDVCMCVCVHKMRHGRVAYLCIGVKPSG